MNDDENAPEKCFIAQALELLEEREHRTLNKIKTNVSSIFYVYDDVPVEKQEFKSGGTDYADAFDENTDTDCNRNENINEELGNEEVNKIMESIENLNVSVSSEVPSVKNYYFYQGRSTFIL